MARVIAVANQKGGVAKTTTVAALSAAWAGRGRKVLAVDLDPQAALTYSLGFEPDDVEPTIHDVLTGRVSLDDTVRTAEEGFDLVPANIALTAADQVLIPLQCETLSHRGVGQLLSTIEDVRRLTNRSLRIIGILPTMFDGRTRHAR